MNSFESVLFDLVLAHCSTGDGEVDAMATTEYAEAIELLAECGKLEIIDNKGTRMVRARITKKV